MSKWLIQGHFQHLHFNNFPMVWRTPQGEVFWPLQSSYEVSGVPEDSQVPISRVSVSSSHSSKSGVATNHLHCLACGKMYARCFWTCHIILFPILEPLHTPPSLVCRVRNLPQIIFPCTFFLSLPYKGSSPKALGRI